jgi:hypothetical protein
LTVLSLLPVYITFSPPHLTTFTLAACPVNTNSSFLVDVFHIRTVLSFEAVAIRGVKDFSLTRWSGSNAIEVIHFEWPSNGCPSG